MTDKHAIAVAPGRPGRKRSESSRLAILAAAFASFGEVGYAGTTVEGIAARAGCGKQTIYRWWPSKADVLLDALAVKADLHVPVSDQGSYVAELRSFLDSSFALARRPQIRDMLCALMAEAQADSEFGARFRTAFLNRRRSALNTIITRAADRGDLPNQPAPATVLDIVFGVIWYRMLATRQPPDAALAEQLVHVLTGVEPQPSRKGAPRA